MRFALAVVLFASLAIPRLSWGQGGGGGGASGGGGAPGGAGGTGSSGTAAGPGGTATGGSSAPALGGTSTSGSSFNSGSSGTAPVQPSSPTSVPGSGALPSQSIPGTGLGPTGANSGSGAPQTGLPNSNLPGNVSGNTGNRLPGGGGSENLVPDVVAPQDVSGANPNLTRSAGSFGGRSNSAPYSGGAPGQLPGPGGRTMGSGGGLAQPQPGQPGNGSPAGGGYSAVPGQQNTLQSNSIPYWRDPDIRWRYVWHRGQWWYWMPDRTWRIWNGAYWMSEPDFQEAYRNFTMDRIRRAQAAQSRVF